VIANGLTAMVVQAEAVPRAVAAGDARAAEAVLGRIEATGRDSLAETRRLLGVLRPADDAPSLVPQPTLASLEGLAERLRTEDLAVELVYEGEPVQLAPGPDLAAYRVVEEALAAAAANGARSATIAVRFEPGSVEVDVSDDRGDFDRDEDPVAQLRDRLGLYGGRIRAEREGGAFRVLARVPVDGVAA
jgi:signal transduction histidine kinase